MMHCIARTVVDSLENISKIFRDQRFERGRGGVHPTSLNHSRRGGIIYADYFLRSCCYHSYLARKYVPGEQRVWGSYEITTRATKTCRKKVLQQRAVHQRRNNGVRVSIHRV